MVDAKLLSRDPKWLLPGDLKDIEDPLYVQAEDELIGEDWLDSYTTEILEAKY